jgi:hypothetical protein
MAEHEYTPQEDAQFDYLMDVLNKSAGEAREIIAKERQETVGARAVAHLVSKPEGHTRKHASRRGGRAYPEPSDSELDPYWNGPALGHSHTPTPADAAAFEQLKQESREATIQAFMTQHDISEVAAAALYKAKREIHGRDS